MRSIAPCVLALLIAGCSAAPESFVGKDRNAVLRALGRPQDEKQWVIAECRIFGPEPSHLQVGDHYTTMWYANVGGKAWSLFLTSPKVFGRVHGYTPPGDASRVVEVKTGRRNVVY